MKGFILDWYANFGKMLLNQYMKRQVALIIIILLCQADKLGENAFWSFDMVVHGIICVWLLRTGSDDRRGSSVMC